jgi:phytoene/squalene synthetase
MLKLYDDVSFRISRIVTKSYSTSFSLAAGRLGEETGNAIYSIYGFVRLADEIVDTFHDFNKAELLSDFEDAYFKSVRDGISLNPVLHSFQLTVKKYGIPYELIKAFLVSMKADLVKTGSYSQPEMDEYIYGSAEVVGLMCLCVFVNGDKKRYEELKIPARKLGAAFQKVNFLRDLKNDVHYLGRSYFSGIDINTFCEQDKIILIDDIEADFSASFTGIKALPVNSRLPVLLAYYYYRCLLFKIRSTKAEKIVNTRVRISDLRKVFLLFKAYIVIKLRLV